MHRWDKNDTMWGEKPEPPPNQKIGTEWPQGKWQAFLLGVFCGVVVLWLGFAAVLDALHARMALVPR